MAHQRGWAEYLAGQSLEGYLEFLAFHAPFVKEIVAAAPSSAAEIGCGGANLSIFLSHLSIQCVAVDLDRGVLSEAATHANSLRAKLDLVRANGLSLPFADQTFDVSFSQGVLEHFSDSMIEAFLAEGLRVSRRLVASMPNCYYPATDFGDERLLPASFWYERGQAAARAAGIPAKVRTADYRRRFSSRHPVRSACNIALRRRFFTMLVINRTEA